MHGLSLSSETGSCLPRVLGGTRDLMIMNTAVDFFIFDYELVIRVDFCENPEERAKSFHNEKFFRNNYDFNQY